MLTQTCPLTPRENAIQAESDAHSKWKRFDEMPRCYILALMSSSLSKKHEDMPTTTDMMLSLYEIFIENDMTQKLAIISEIMNTRQSEGTILQNHIMKMIALF